MARDYALMTTAPFRIPGSTVAVVIGAAVVATLTALSGWTVFAIVLGALLALFLLLAVFTYVVAKRSCALSYPPGSTVRLTVGPEALTSEAAIGSSTLDYGAILDVVATANAVILKLRGGAGIRMLVPRALFAPGDLELLTQRVAEAAPHPGR